MVRTSRRATTAVETASVASLASGTLALVAGFALVAMADSLPLTVQLVPLAVSVLVLGLPHGAVDHLLLPRARGVPVTLEVVAVVCVGYLVLAGLYLVGWFLAPVAAFVGFILLTAFHWGQGDLYAVVAFYRPAHLERRRQRLLTLAVRGAIPMFVPLVAFPDQYAFVATAVVGLFDPAAATALEPAFESTSRTAVATGIAALVGLSLGLGAREAGISRGWALDAGETLGLVAFFAIVPPILAIGLYFALWHSVRHVLRTLLVDRPAAAAVARGEIGHALWRFSRDAAPFTVGGIVVLVAIAVTVPQSPSTLPDLLGAYLVCLAVLTLPHTVVVSLLDREQRVWT